MKKTRSKKSCDTVPLSGKEKSLESYMTPFKNWPSQWEKDLEI
jgi:hypothetical protein